MRIMLIGVLLLTFIGVVKTAGISGEVFNVPLGITDLFSSANQTVGYQYFGKDSCSLGSGWSGYDPTSGIYFQPEDTPDRISQVFMHCPWVGGAGIAFADYALKFPATTRIKMSFEIGIRLSANTDGVTYRIRAGEKILFEKHCTWKGIFQKFDVDLSEFAGKEIILRLEVDPGPERNTTDDWSLWRGVQVSVGTEKEVADAEAIAQAEHAKLRAKDIEQGNKLAETSLMALTAHANASVCPSVLNPVSLEVKKEGDAYVFLCKGSDETIEYRFQPGEGLLSGISVRVNGKAIEPPLFSGGPVIHLDERGFGMPNRLIRTQLVNTKLDGLKLVCKYRYINPETGSSVELKSALWPEGKSLGIEVWGEENCFGSFAVRTTGQKVNTAFAVGSGPVWRKEGIYTSSVVDLMKSEASGVGRGDFAVYSKLTNGRRNAMHDIFYLTVSSRYEEVLPNLTHKPSPFLNELSGCVVLDMWSGTFSQHEQWLKDISNYGVNNFLIICHVWQRDGYDRSYPNVMPANAKLGGDEGLSRLSTTAQKIGHRFNVHENYYDYYPNAEAFKESDRALNAQGQPIPGWDRGPVKAVILKPSKLMDYVNEFTPEIKKRYDCNSAYHDIMPTWNVDFDASVKDAGKIRVTHEYTRQLCDFDRKIFSGPVVFEAADPFTAGIYDGGCNHGVDTYRTPPSVAFELLKVHPKMSNHGFGYYERWLPWGYSRPNWSSYVMTDRELDKFRAYQIAFGRTGFIGQQLMKHPHGVVREYYLMQAFGRAYTGKLAKRIRYEMNGKWVDAGTSARYGELSRLNVEYEDNQQVFVNLSDADWQIAGYVLPPNGMLTTGPRVQAWTALRDNQICDYSSYENVVYADARSHQWLPSADLQPIEPSFGNFKHIDGKKFELTVNWKAGRKPERNFTVFWHFVADGAIKFQYDHPPAKKTTEWGVGETFSDGPSQMEVQDDLNVKSYDIIVGLYDKEGRALLVKDFNSIKIGRLIVERDGAVAKSVVVEQAMDKPYGFDSAPYLEGANTGKKIIDFGSIATNGAIVVRKTKGNFEVIPVPIGQSMKVGIDGVIKRATAYSQDGKPLNDLSIQFSDGKTWFDIPADATKIECR